VQAYKTFGSRVAVVQKKLQEHPALSKTSVSSHGDCDSNEDSNERQYQVNSPDSTTPRSYDGSEDSNSPLEYFNPADYFVEPLNDEDICKSFLECLFIFVYLCICYLCSFNK